MSAVQQIAAYRASSCTLCGEDNVPATRAAKEQAPLDSFEGEVLRATAESWATGRLLGEGAFAAVRLAQGTKTGRIVS